MSTVSAAVLFNVLAGRPPFLGPNPVSVIRQASETQAPKLRSWHHRSIEIWRRFVHDASNVNPKARYQAAGDLAADLERWLDGRPIVARPFHPQRGSGAGRSVIPNWLEQRLPVYFWARLPFGHFAANSSGRRSLIPQTGEACGALACRYRINLIHSQFPDYIFSGRFRRAPPGHSRDRRAPRGRIHHRVPDRPLEAGLRTNKITADVIAAPPKTAFNTSARDRALEASLRTNKLQRR